MRGHHKRILPADVYDALELVAEAYGGIGASKFAVDHTGRHVLGYDRRVIAPVCIVGAAQFADGSDKRTIEQVLYRAAIFTTYSDAAVWAINERLGSPDRDARVPFADLCAELGVERGS